MRYSSAEREVKESWLLFKAHILKTQEWSIPTRRKSSKGCRRSAWMKKTLVTKSRHEKQAFESWRHSQVTQQD